MQVKNVHVIALLAALGAVVLSGCQTTHVSLSDHGPVAIVSVTGNQALPWELTETLDDDDDDGNGVLTTMVNKMIDSTNPELTTGKDRLDYAVDSLRASLLDIANVDVLDADAVIHAQNYEDIVESPFGVLDTRIAADGYKLLTSLGAKRARMLMEETGAKSLVFVEFDFRKSVVKGTKRSGQIGPMLTMKARVLNERGKEIINREFVLKATEGVRVSGGKYDKGELVGLYPELIDNAISQFVVSYIQ